MKKEFKTLKYVIYLWHVFGWNTIQLISAKLLLTYDLFSVLAYFKPSTALVKRELAFLPSSSNI